MWITSTEVLLIVRLETFYDNQPFIDWRELNRIEEACRFIHNNIQSRINGRKKLAFTLNGGDF